jgi:hypothetical protein
MKKGLGRMIGIDYIAVGGGGDEGPEGDPSLFKEDVKVLFKDRSDDPTKPMMNGERWVWAKKIDPAKEIRYLDDKDEVVTSVTRKIQVQVSLQDRVPSNETLVYSRFALLAIDFKDGTFNTDLMFFVNYVKHEPITKDRTIKLVRDIIIDFPATEIKQKIMNRDS